MQDIMKARKKDTAVKPPAQLEPHPGDFDLPPSLYLECGVFKRLKMKPSTDKFPGTLVLRKYRAGRGPLPPGRPRLDRLRHPLRRRHRGHAPRARPTSSPSCRPASSKHIAKNKHEEQAQATRRCSTACRRPSCPSRSRRPARRPGPRRRRLPRHRRPAPPARPAGWRRLFGAKDSRSRRAKKAISVDAPTTIDHGLAQGDDERGQPVRPVELHLRHAALGDHRRRAATATSWRCCATSSTRSCATRSSRRTRTRSYRRERPCRTTSRGCRSSRTSRRSSSPRSARASQLKRYKDGEVIFKRGDESTSMYIVRRGVVKVLVEDAGGESVLTYLSQGDFFGEMGVVQEQAPQRDLRRLRPPRPGGRRGRRPGRQVAQGRGARRAGRDPRRAVPPPPRGRPGAAARRSMRRSSVRAGPQPEARRGARLGGPAPPRRSRTTSRSSA